MKLQSVTCLLVLIFVVIAPIYGNYQPPQRNRKSTGGAYSSQAQDTEGDEEDTNFSSKSKKTPPPYALSYVYVRHLAKVEESLYSIMKNYENVLKSRLKIVSNYVKDYEDSSVRGTKHINESELENDPLAKASVVAAHPLMSYRLIKRFSSEIDALGRDLTTDVETQLKMKVSELQEGRPWPTKYDHEMAMDALLRLQYVYDLDLKELTTGKVGPIQTDVGLTAKQCFHIAKFATYANFYTLALDWLSVTSWKVLNSTEEGRNEVGANTIALAYRHTVEKHNKEIAETGNSGNLYTYVKPITTNILPEKARDKSLRTIKGLGYKDLDELDELSDEDSAEHSHFDYITLCNGNSTKSDLQNADLRCYYERKKNPYWYINPLKVEIRNIDPPLIQIYEFISDKWIKTLIEKATPISYAPPQNNGRATPRTAAYAWLNDSEIPEVPLSRKIELFTLLKVRGEIASTSLQIASYIYGGHVSNHVDSLGEDSDDRGDRVTTFLIYLNDVPAGGYTAYPVLGTHVKPTKGSAVLWYTALKNGDIDNRMLHGACPPIFGYKWIATKWTHLNENMFTRPCDLDPDV